MRLVRALPAYAILVIAGLAQQPVALGPDRSAGMGTGVVKFFDWYHTPSVGCTPGSGYCSGATPQGDTFNWSAWMPNSSGLPVTGGLPIVGTANDFTLAGRCSGNVSLLQLDTWNWSAPSSAHMSVINCMSSYGTSPSDSNSPNGWFGHLTGNDSVGNSGTWKNRTIFSKGGILYLPVERQIPAGTASVHDATFIMSPDSGKHWCNPYTLYKVGTPGVCDSSKWSATGDAPLCGATSSSTPCTDPGYLDATHSSMMFKALPNTMETWYWVNYGNQDGKAPPAGITDGCDPATYTCFIAADGGLARVRNADILDVSAWQYYSCPSSNQSYRCPGSAPENWTSTFANRTKTFGTGAAHSSTLYIKEFKSYVSFTCGADGWAWSEWAPTIQGPWTLMNWNPFAGTNHAFFSLSPALGYSVLSTSPPHVRITANTNSYHGGQGSPMMSLWDLVLGRNTGGEAFTATNTSGYIQGSQFSSGNIAGSFPRKGLVWSFDYPDLTILPYFSDRARSSAIVAPCNGGTYTEPTLCGSVNNGKGTSSDASGIHIAERGYGGHFRVFPGETSGYSVSQNAPAAMQGNGSYSVVGVYRYEGVTPFHRPGGIWSTGLKTGGVNPMIEFNQVDGKLQLEWGATAYPHFMYLSNFTFPNFSNWYFIAVTVQAQTGACGPNCAPAARVWVGGAVTPGVVTDTLAGAAYTAVNGATIKTPNVAAGPFILGLNANADSYAGTGASGNVGIASTMVYGRALTAPEVQFMYRSMKAKMAARGVTLQ